MWFGLEYPQTMLVFYKGEQVCAEPDYFVHGKFAKCS